MPVPFKVTGTHMKGAEEVSCDDAKQALDAYDRMRSKNYQKITVTDDLGRSLTEDHLGMLVAVGDTNA
jgi:hypothetical protein